MRTVHFLFSIWFSAGLYWVLTEGLQVLRTSITGVTRLLKHLTYIAVLNWTKYQIFDVLCHVDQRHVPWHEVAYYTALLYTALLTGCIPLVYSMLPFRWKDLWSMINVWKEVNAFGGTDVWKFHAKSQQCTRSNRIITQKSASKRDCIDYMQSKSSILIHRQNLCTGIVL